MGAGNAADEHWISKNSRIEHLPDFRFTVIPSGTADRSQAGKVIRDSMVAMRDGVCLATDVYLPEGDGPFPTVLCRMPYGKTEPYAFIPLVGDHFARKGYAFVAQDVRGKFGSEGTFVPNSGANEINDGYDTIEWISQQPWSNQRVGMWGESYYGFTTYAGGVSGHPNLVCIAPGNVSPNRYDCTFRAGAMQLSTIGVWAIQLMSQSYQDISSLDLRYLPLADLPKSAGLESAYFDQFIENPTFTAFWRDRSLLTAYDIRIPVLNFGGWYDLYLGYVISNWERLRGNNPGTDHNYLFIGPWDHEASSDNIGRVGRVKVSDQVASQRWDTIEAFFDKHLMQLDNGFGARGKVRYYTIGADTWQESAAWPPENATVENYYFHSNGRANTLSGDGTLSADLPGSEPADQFVYDPQDPVADTQDVDCFAIAAQMADRSQAAQRADVLCYTSQPLAHDLEISGPIKARLYAASSAVNTDFTVSLVDVYPDGYGNLIQDGILRVSYRDPASPPSNIEPGKVYALDVDIWSTSYLVKQGHRLRVEVSSSNFSRYDRNPNTGEAYGRSARTIPATQTILHAEATPSHIALPIVRKATAAKPSQPPKP